MPSDNTTDPAVDGHVNQVSASLMSNGQEETVQNDEDQDRGIVVNASDMPDDVPGAKKKKKKSKKPASKRGLGKPTGFEEFHADAPLTLEQFAESKEVFHPEIMFVDRILRAIQRFERTRKLTPERRDVFYKYLAYGGVDVGPNMFVGSQNTEDMDKDQINSAMAQASISDETKRTILDPKQEADSQQISSEEEGSKLRSPEYMARYVVDFEATMRGFLSRHAPSLYPFDTADRVKMVTTTLERFMDYLLQHDVCPEYTTEVLSTRNLCRAAESELWQCAEAHRHLPGDFNIASSTLFGGVYSQNYDGETYWGPQETEDQVFVGLKPEKATQIVGFAIAGAASEDVYQEYLKITTGDSKGMGFRIEKTISDHGFEITKIENPSQECLDLYKENTAEFGPVGTVHAKFFRNPDAPPEDLTLAERTLLATESNSSLKPHAENESKFVFFIESKPLLSLLRPGMRIEATIYQLNCGVWFFDEVIRVLPSFDLWIENELMLGWKEPRPVTGAPKFAWKFGGTTEEADEKEASVELAPISENSVNDHNTASHETGESDTANGIIANHKIPENASSVQAEHNDDDGDNNPY